MWGARRGRQVPDAGPPGPARRSALPRVVPDFEGGAPVATGLAAGVAGAMAEITLRQGSVAGEGASGETPAFLVGAAAA